MVSELILNDLKRMVHEWMTKQGISNYKVDTEGCTESGDNYMTEIIFFKVIIEDGKKVHNLVMKTAKRAKELAESFPTTLAYNKEVLAYSEVFPTFKQYLKEKNSDFRFDIVPNMYWTTLEESKESIILDNLIANGYKLFDRTKPWDLQRALFVMANYGKYHAVSFALKAQKPEVFEKLVKRVTNVDIDYANNLNFKEFYEAPWINVMKMIREAGRDDIFRKFCGFEDNIEKSMSQGPEEGDQLVITHGDCWSNNFLFKYQDESESKITNVCMLDFQLLTVDSPVKDLSYNIYSTCDKSCLDHFDLLLQTYYDSLSKTAEDLGCSIKDTFTFQTLKEHWKKYSNYGLTLSVVITKATLLKKHEAPNLEKLAKEGKNPNQCFHIKIENEEEYNRRMIDLLSHYANVVL